MINNNNSLLKNGYKKTEIGIIPEDWKVTPFTNIAKLKHGFQFMEEHFSKNGIPVIKIGNLINNAGLDLSKLTYVSKDISNRFYKFTLNEGDILMALTGATLGKVARVNSKLELLQNYRVGKFIPNSKTDRHYLYHISQSFLIQQTMKYLVNEAAQPNLGKADFDKIQIPLPPLPEQKAIAEVLSDTDELIQTLEKKIAKKRLIKQGAMQVLLSPPATAQMLNGELSMVNEKEKWEVKKLGEICERITTGKLDANAMIKDGKYRFYTCAKDYYLIDDYVFDTEALLVSGNGANVGYIHYYKGKFNAYQRTYVLYGFEENIHFIKLFMDKFLKLRIDEQKNDGNTPYIKMDTLTEMEINLPPQDEQIRIATILSDMDSEIETLENKLAKYKKIKQGMMQELLTGKIRLVNIAQINKENRVKVVPIKQKEKQKLRKDHNWQINEAVVISVLTEKFGSEDYPLGRKRYTKFSYLLHRHSEHKAEGYLKKAAGPYNPSTKYKGPESIAQKNKYIQRKKKGKLSGFVAAENIEKAQEYFKKWYGDEALEWLEQFMFETNDTLELWTTVDMAIQDLREKEKVVTVETVKSLINNHKEWKPKLKRPVFSDENIEIAINKLQSILKEH